MRNTSVSLGQHFTALLIPKCKAGVMALQAMSYGQVCAYWKNTNPR